MRQSCAFGRWMVPRDLARVNEPTAHRDVRFGSLAGQKRTFGAYEALPTAPPKTLAAVGRIVVDGVQHGRAA